MQFPLRSLFAFSAWAACTCTVLGLGRLHLPGAYEHAICGPWGCGPRVMDLLSYHLFLICLIALPCYCVAVFVRRSVALRLAKGLILIGLAILAGLLLHEVATGWNMHRDHFLQRYLFRVATSVDLPAMAVIVGGLIIWRVSPVSTSVPADDGLTPDQIMAG